MPAGSHSIKTKGSVVSTHAVRAAASGGNGLADGRQPEMKKISRRGRERERERDKDSESERVDRGENRPPPMSEGRSGATISQSCQNRTVGALRGRRHTVIVFGFVGKKK